jgi:hypothetical protein
MCDRNLLSGHASYFKFSGVLESLPELNSHKQDLLRTFSEKLVEQWLDFVDGSSSSQNAFLSWVAILLPCQQLRSWGPSCLLQTISEVLLPSSLDCVILSVLATGPKGRRFNPGRGNWLLRVIKILSTPSFGWEVKPEVPCRKILSLEIFQILIGKIHFVQPSYLPHMSLLVGLPELWWTSQE